MGMQWSDGRLYEGNYFEDKKHGTGCFTWPDGRRYDGQWKDGKQDGFGRYINTNKKVRHGEWKDGKRIRWVDEEHDFEPEEAALSPRDDTRPAQDAPELNPSPQSSVAEGQRSLAPEQQQQHQQQQ